VLFLIACLVEWNIYLQQSVHTILQFQHTLDFLCSGYVFLNCSPSFFFRTTTTSPDQSSEGQLMPLILYWVENTLLLWLVTLSGGYTFGTKHLCTERSGRCSQSDCTVFWAEFHYQKSVWLHWHQSANDPELTWPQSWICGSIE